MLGGSGVEASVDGGYFGGYIKPANLRENRVDRRLAHNQNGKRKCVVIIREHGGDSLPAVFNSEAAATKFIASHLKPGTVVNADEASSWDGLHAKFEMKRINLQRRPIRWMRSLFEPERRAISRACAVVRSATITMSQFPTFALRSGSRMEGR